MKAFAQLISYIFHPIWMPVYVVLLFWEMDSRVHFYNHSSAWFYILLVVLINSVVIPLLMIWMLKRLGIINSLLMESRKDRIYPFLITGIFYVTSWFVFNNLGVLDLIAYLFIVASLLVFLALIVNIYWKISVHTMSMGALSVFIIYLTSVHFLTLSWPAYFIVLMSGLVGFARLKLESHSPAQVYSGYFAGALVTLLFLMGLGWFS